MKKNDKIYVAGHRGLVGSTIVQKLISAGYTNILQKTRDELNLLNQAEVADFFDREKPDYVFLAAATVGGIHANFIYRADFIYQNLSIQNHIIHQSFLRKVKKLLFLGSTCIYPKEASQPMKESELLTGQLEYTNEPYAVAKIAGMKMCESYNLQYKTNFISVMPTNLYGPGDNFDLEKSHVLPALMRKLHLAKLLSQNKKEEIVQDLGVENFADAENKLSVFGVNSKQVEIWGTGKPKREFLHSRDLADACVYLMEKINFEDLIDPENPEIRNSHVNVGTGEEISIRQLAETIQKIVGFEGELVFNTNKPDGTLLKRTDPGKIHSLGWKHQISLEEGVRQFYRWYLNRP